MTVSLRSGLVLAVVSALLLVGAWALRIHDSQEINHRFCRMHENTNTALRLVIAARLNDPSTPDAVKQRFVVILDRYLQPVDCGKF
jgi:hypothetical protein